MNIDIVNRQIAANLGIKEGDVKLINHFYWRQVYDHLYSFDSRPVNIENVCVFYPHKKLVKETILKYVKRIRRIKISKKFKQGSPIHKTTINECNIFLQKFLKLRKENKFTN